MWFFLAVEPAAALSGAIGFGIGAAAVEVVSLPLFSLLDQAGSVGGGDPPATAGSAGPDRFVDWSGVIERGSAYAGHIASRGLVWLSIQSWHLVSAAVLALALFALVDGVATYGREAGWNWSAPDLCRRFQAFLAGVAAAEWILFALGIVGLRAMASQSQ